VAGIFLSLKVAVLKNRAAAVRRNPATGQSIVITVLVLGFFIVKYGPGFYATLSRSGSFPDPGPIFAQLSFSVVFLWIVLTLTYGGRRDLDVRKLQLLPIRPAAIAVGLATTLVFSPGLWLTAGLAVVLAASFPDATSHLPLLALSGVALVLLCAITGQLIAAGADLLARQRHARDLLLLLTFVLAAVPVVLFFVVRSQFEGGAAAPGSGVMQWVPLAWPGVAMAAAGQGLTGIAWAALAGTFLLIALGGWAWTGIIARSMLAQDSSTTRPARAGDPYDGFARRLPASRRGAVAALELRLLWREPTRLPGAIMATLIFGGIFTVIAAALFDVNNSGLAVFGVCAISFCAVGRRVNEIGLHASELWTNVVAPGRAADDLVGRDLASAIIDLPVVVIALLAIAVDRGEWSYVLPALVFGASAVLATYGGLRVFNVAFAKAQPRSKDAAATPQRQSPLLNLLALLTWIISTTPVFAAAALVAAFGTEWLIVALPAAVAYSGGLWVISLRSVGRWLDQHEAALLVRIQGG